MIFPSSPEAALDGDHSTGGFPMERQRHQEPWAAIDAAVGEDEAVLGELELAADQSILNLPGSAVKG